MILILGGTAEARDLAAQLIRAGQPVRSSLAGRVGHPRLPEGETRVGGFGGAQGLADYLDGENVRAVVDATHPFAAGISANAAQACRAVDVPLLRFERAGWQTHPLAPTWTWVEDHGQACGALAGRRPFLTTGRQSFAAFAALPDAVMRVVDPLPVPPGWMLLRGRGPYLRESERALLHCWRIGVLVTKDSGGALTEAKLWAAHDLGIETVVVRRPAAVAGVSSVAAVSDVLEWVSGLPGS